MWGERVNLGKYNHRDIIWDVIKVEADKILLLSHEILESSYIAKHYAGGAEAAKNYADSYVNRYTQGMYYDLKENYEDILLPNSQGEYVFLLSKDDIEALDETYRLAPVRYQAKMNGYENYGIYCDDDGKYGAWWTSTDDEGYLVYVTPEGDFDSQSIETEDCGIRPAVWVARH